MLQKEWQRFGIMCFFSWVVFGNLGMAQIQPCTCRLDGYVTAQTTGGKLHGAVAEAQGRQASTEANGYFILSNLCPGEVVLTIHYIGYHTYTKKVPLAVNATTHADATLLDEDHALDEIEIDGKRRPVQTAASATDKLTDTDIQAAAGDPLAALLAKQPGVNLFRTGPTVLKPVLRGLHSARVLVLNAGVRHEGQQWGAEHAPEIDPLANGTLTLIRGAATVRYGPEALGGVILAEPPKLLDTAGLSGGITLAGATNNGMGATSGWVAFAPKQIPGLAGRVQGTFRKAGDSRTPTYVLSNTGLEEINGSYQVGYTRNRWGIAVNYAQFNTKLGIMYASSIGNLTDLNQALTTRRPLDVRPFTYTIQNPYQKVEHELLTAKSFYHISNKTKLEVQIARQYNGRSEYDRDLRYGVANSRGTPGLVLNLTTWSLEALLSHQFGQHLQAKVGISGYYGTKAGGFDVNATRFILRSLIPDYDNLLVGIFTILEGEKGAFTYEIGTRLDHKRYTIQPGAWKGYSTERTFLLPSITTSLARLFGQHLTADATLSSSARPPSVAELFSRGVHQSSASIEVGNPNIQAERMTAASLGLTWNPHHWRLKGSAYLHHFQGYINRVPQYPPALTVAGVLPVFAFVPQNALFSGIEGEAAITLHPILEVGGTVALVRARDVSTGRFLLQIPSDRYRFFFAAKANKPVWGFLKQPFARVDVQWVRKQIHPGNLLRDSLDYADAPDGYALVGASAGGSFLLGKHLATLSFEAQNILNHRYRDYLDQFRYFADAPGRNLLLRLTVPFTIL